MAELLKKNFFLKLEKKSEKRVTTKLEGGDFFRLPLVLSAKMSVSLAMVLLDNRIQFYLNGWIRVTFTQIGNPGYRYLAG